LSGKRYEHKQEHDLKLKSKKLYIWVIKINSTIVLRNSINEPKNLVTYNGNGIQPFSQRKNLGMPTTTHYAIQERKQVVQTSCPKHFQCGHQPTNKYQNFMQLPNNIKQLENSC
jgi:hypothetical protein